MKPFFSLLLLLSSAQIVLAQQADSTSLEIFRQYLFQDRIEEYGLKSDRDLFMTLQKKECNRVLKK